MSTRGVRRYLTCLEYLEAKYNNEIAEDEYDRRLRSYEAFNDEPPLSVPDGLAVDTTEPADDVGDDNETDTDDDSVGSLAEFLAAEDEEA
jgi:hypothetical protein